MNIRTLMSFVLIFVTALLGACDTMVQLPDRTWHGAHGAGNLNHASTYVARWACDTDKEGKRTNCRELKPGEYIQGPAVVGQMAIAAVGGTGAALINGNTGRAIARIGQCPAGSVCPGATVITNQVQSVAEALNNNQVQIGVNAGATAPTCAATNTCGK